MPNSIWALAFSGKRFFIRAKAYLGIKSINDFYATRPNWNVRLRKKLFHA